MLSGVDHKVEPGTGIHERTAKVSRVLAPKVLLLAPTHSAVDAERKPTHHSAFYTSGERKCTHPQTWNPPLHLSLLCAIVLAMATKSTYVPVHTEPADEPKASDKRQRRRWARWIADGWLVETACTILGIVFIVSLCIVLRAYEGEPVPSFGTALGATLTLNTIVAIISTCAKAAFLLPVAECISQLKWCHFEKDYQPLTDLGIFDRASRGTVGGLELLWRTKFK